MLVSWTTINPMKLVRAMGAIFSYYDFQSFEEYMRRVSERVVRISIREYKGKMRGCFKGRRVGGSCYDVIVFVVDQSGGFIRHRVQETRQSRKGGRWEEGREEHSPIRLRPQPPRQFAVFPSTSCAVRFHAP